MIGTGFYGDSTNYAFFTMGGLRDYYNLELENSIIDEIKIDNVGNLPYSSDKEEWLYSTVLHGEFKDSLEAGNIDNKGLPIEYIRFKKRKKDSLEWQEIIDIPFNTLEKIYQFTDRLVCSTEEYEYAIVPLTSTIEGRDTVASVECKFDGAWLCDRDNGYQLIYNLNYGEIENVVNSKSIETMSGYPTVVYGDLDYARSNVRAMMVAEESEYESNPKAERLNRDKLFKYLKNKKSKNLKDGNGRYYLVSIVNNPREIPNNNLNQAISEVSFNWVEIGDAEKFKG